MSFPPFSLLWWLNPLTHRSWELSISLGLWQDFRKVHLHIFLMTNYKEKQTRQPKGDTQSRSKEHLERVLPFSIT